MEKKVFFSNWKVIPWIASSKSSNQKPYVCSGKEFQHWLATNKTLGNGVDWVCVWIPWVFSGWVPKKWHCQAFWCAIYLWFACLVITLAKFDPINVICISCLVLCHGIALSLNDKRIIQPRRKDKKWLEMCQKSRNLYSFRQRRQRTKSRSVNS